MVVTATASSPLPGSGWRSCRTRTPQAGLPAQNELAERDAVDYEQLMTSSRCSLSAGTKIQPAQELSVGRDDDGGRAHQDRADGR